jgi:hypothetical protein
MSFPNTLEIYEPDMCWMSWMTCKEMINSEGI